MSYQGTVMTRQSKAHDVRLAGVWPLLLLITKLLKCLEPKSAAMAIMHTFPF